MLRRAWDDGALTPVLLLVGGFNLLVPQTFVFGMALILPKSALHRLIAELAAL